MFVDFYAFAQSHGRVDEPFIKQKHILKTEIYLHGLLGSKTPSSHFTFAKGEHF